MEDYSPQGLDAKGLPNEDYIRIITNLVQSVPFSSVSFTGGEPLTNRGLVDIVKAVRPYVGQLEITTNGTLVTPVKMAELISYFDRVKISMDSVDSEKFRKITGLKLASGIEKVKNAIHMIRDSGVEVAVNCVVMNSNISEITDVIYWAREQKVKLHLLDFYYTDECREIWEREFVPLEDIMPALTKKYGKPEEEDRFGCKFLTFDFEMKYNALRLKTSFSGTMRSKRCEVCAHYCQEGLYGLKLSQKGWVTPCPSNEETDGVMCKPEWDVNQTKSAIAWMVDDIESAELKPDSFQVFIEKNGLRFPGQG